MEIKFNCANPNCRQRISVDESMGGQSLLCPACATVLQVPASTNIKFNCSNPECEQHMVVDVSEAGRFVRCPACNKPLQVPGSPAKSIASKPLSQTAGEKPVVLTKRSDSLVEKKSFQPVKVTFLLQLWWLLRGWS